MRRSLAISLQHFIRRGVSAQVALKRNPAGPALPFMMMAPVTNIAQHLCFSTNPSAADNSEDEEETADIVDDDSGVKSPRVIKYSFINPFLSFLFYTSDV